MSEFSKPSSPTSISVIKTSEIRINSKAVIVNKINSKEVIVNKINSKAVIVNRISKIITTTNAEDSVHAKMYLSIKISIINTNNIIIITRIRSKKIGELNFFDTIIADYFSVKLGS